MNAKKINWIGLLVPLAFCIVACIAKTIVLSGDTPEATFYGPVVHPGYETTPATVKVSPSTSKAWEMTKKSESARTWKAIGTVSLWAFLLVLALSALEVIDTPKVIGTCVVLLILYGAGNYAAYSSVYSNNYITIPRTDYDKIKDTPGAIDALFDNRPVLR